jgi:hypothetical protein
LILHYDERATLRRNSKEIASVLAIASQPRFSVQSLPKSPPKCAYCHGKLGLLVSHHWALRFCSRRHKEEYLRAQQQQRDHHHRWLGYLSKPLPEEK